MQTGQGCGTSLPSVTNITFPTTELQPQTLQDFTDRLKYLHHLDIDMVLAYVGGELVYRWTTQLSDMLVRQGQVWVL
jgi:hypothetical protein